MVKKNKTKQQQEFLTPESQVRTLYSAHMLCAQTSKKAVQLKSTQISIILTLTNTIVTRTALRQANILEVNTLHNKNAHTKWCKMHLDSLINQFCSNLCQ